MEHSYKYAILRVVPDRRRGECVNIGVAVFKDQDVDVRLNKSLSKVAALDGSINLHQLQGLPDTMNKYLASMHTIEEKYAAFKDVGMISLSELGWFECSDGQYENTVKRIMTALVEPRPRVRATASTTKLSASLKETFRQQKILGKDEDDILRHLVVPNYPLAPNEGLFADFTLKNGAYHVTETADLRSDSASSPERRRIAADAAIKLDVAHKKLNAKRYVVYGASHGSDSSTQINLLGDYSDGIYNIESRSDMASYLQIMMSAAGQNQSI